MRGRQVSEPRGRAEVEIVKPGYELVETDQRVGDYPLATRFTRRGILRAMEKNRPIVSTYHTRIIRAGFGRWRLVAFQNVLREIKTKGPK